MEILYNNDGFYTKEHINMPIVIEGVCAGLITDVDKDHVHGVIWDKFVSRRVYADSGKLCDLSINIK